MNIVVDTNVVLDVLLMRDDFVESGKAIFRRVESGAVKASVSATTVTAIDYYLSRELGHAASRNALRNLMRLFDVAAVNRSTVDAALASPMQDFEDAVLAYSAHAHAATAIVTRNLRDFDASPVRAYTPEQWLALNP